MKDNISQDLKHNLNQKNNKSRQALGIYIHIPFCEKKCDYCDFLSAPSNKETKQEYVDALIREIKSYHELADDYIVKTIFIGGGTPSSIHEQYIVKILEVVRETFHLESDENGIEITIETNPGTLTKEKLRAYRLAGINRLSIGLQSADNKELKLLGRIHTYEEFVENYYLAREIGFTNINIDLMSALPNQTEEDFMNTLYKVIDLGPEHISAYSLIIEEGTVFYNKYGEESKASKELPDEDTERNIYIQTNNILQKYGYERYEISNYAKLGYESKHNSSYWKRIDYLGLGLGASSLIHHIRYHNETDLNEYIKESKESVSLKREEQELTIKEQMEEFMFLGLRMCEGIKKSEFQLSFSHDIEEIYGDVLREFLDQKLIQVSGDRISLTQKGLDISNYVFSKFLLDN
jgi:oxygen-independent coproporphyrinogen-3 oxidase